MNPLPNPQADIVVGFGCNALCGFCVQEATRKTQVNPNWCEPLTRSVAYLYSNGIRRFVITGGEPTLKAYANRTIEALGVLSGFGGIEFKALYTNGAGLLNDNLTTRLAQAGLTGVNLSCHHHDPERDNLVFGIKRPSVPKIVETSIDNGLSVRLNCTLMRGGVDSFEGLRDYLAFAQKLGVGSVYFRELFEFKGSALYVPTEHDTRDVLGFTKARRFDCLSLVDAARADSEFSLENDWRVKNAGQGSEISFLFRGNLRIGFAKLTIGQEAPGKGTYWVVMPTGLLYDAFTSEEQLVEVA